MRFGIYDDAMLPEVCRNTAHGPLGACTFFPAWIIFLSFQHPGIVGNCLSSIYDGHYGSQAVYLRGAAASGCDLAAAHLPPASDSSQDPSSSRELMIVMALSTPDCCFGARSCRLICFRSHCFSRDCELNVFYPDRRRQSAPTLASSSFTARYQGR